MEGGDACLFLRQRAGFGRGQEIPPKSLRKAEGLEWAPSSVVCER